MRVLGGQPASSIHQKTKCPNNLKSILKTNKVDDVNQKSKTTHFKSPGKDEALDNFDTSEKPVVVSFDRAEGELTKESSSVLQCVKSHSANLLEQGHNLEYDAPNQ